MWTIGMILVGVLIGWQFPQPEWARSAQSQISAWLRVKWQEWTR